MSSRKVMDVISNVKDTAPPIQKACPNPRDRPMYGRPGVTMGQHLDEFADYEDEWGRSFEQLVYNILHRRGPPLPLPQAPNARSSRNMGAKSNNPTDAPVQKKIHVDDYTSKLKYRHVVEARKRLVEDVETKDEKDTTNVKLEQKAGPKETTSSNRVVTYGQQKRPGASRYF